MDLLYKPDFDRVKKYWKAYWEKEIIDRPCVYITAPKDNCSITCRSLLAVI